MTSQQSMPSRLVSRPQPKENIVIFAKYSRDRPTRQTIWATHAMLGASEKCFASGRNDYVSKPIVLETFAAALDRGLCAGLGQGYSIVPDATV
jgi:CheY-like chemotaxis protein